MDLINSINIDLELDVPENEARSTSQALCDGLVLPALEKVMHRFEEEDVVIEQPLVIDVGDVTEGQLSYAVEDAFYRALAKCRRTAVVSSEVSWAQALQPAPDAFMEYLRYPVLPWDVDDMKQFDGQRLIVDAAQKALASDIYMERLIELVVDSVETCKRFFDQPWPKEAFQSILRRMLLKIPTLQRTAYGRLLQLFGEEGSVKPSLVQEVFYYILSGVLFGNRRDAVNREAVAVLLVEGKEGMNVSSVKSGVPSERVDTTERETVLPHEQVAQHVAEDEFFASIADGSETRPSPEIQSAIAEKREALKQRLAHDERLRSRLHRLIDLVDIVLRGVAPFTQHVTEMERLIEELWRGEAVPLTQGREDVQEETEMPLEPIAEEISSVKPSSPKETESARLSEEKVVDVVASLSVLRDAEQSKEESSETRGESIREAVSRIARRQPELDKRIPVHNAGLVLFQPFLISYFDRLGLLESRKSFNSLESQLRAAHLLHELSGFKGEQLEHLLPLNKLLCGINIMFPIGSTFEATEEERHEVEALLKAVIRNWSAIGNASPAGIQEAFVRREGLLERSQDEWILRVESKGIDILLDYIPWDIHTVSLPWNDYLIFVDWKV